MCFKSMKKQMHKLEQKKCNTKVVSLYLRTKVEFMTPQHNMRQDMTI